MSAAKLMTEIQKQAGAAWPGSAPAPKSPKNPVPGSALTGRGPAPGGRTKVKVVKKEMTLFEVVGIVLAGLVIIFLIVLILYYSGILDDDDSESISDVDVVVVHHDPTPDVTVIHHQPPSEGQTVVVVQQ